MNDTASKLSKILETKAAIKQAIIDKGVEVGDDTVFADYPTKISAIETGGGEVANPYYEELFNLRTNNGTSMRGLFYYCSVSDLDLRGLDVSAVTDMFFMFDHCTSNVNVEGWDTSKVTNTERMFNYFSGSIDLSKLDFSSVTRTDYMFYGVNINGINLTGLSFPSAISLNYLFNSAEGDLLDLSSWDISNIATMSSMFYSAKIKKIDLTGWKTTNVTDMSNMFQSYSSDMTELIIPDWDMTNTTKYSNFFNSGSSYTKALMLIDLSRSNDTTITKIASTLPIRTTTTYGKVIIPSESSQGAINALITKYWKPVGPRIDMTSCKIDPELNEIKPGKSTKLYYSNPEPWYGNDVSVEYVLSDESVATIDQENKIITSTGIEGSTEIIARIADTQKVISEPFVFSVSETDNYPNVIKFRGPSTPGSSNYIKVNGTDVKLSNMNYNPTSGIYTYDVGAPITSIQFNGQSGSTGNNTCTDVVKINTSNVTDMSRTFVSCSNLTSLDLSDFDTSQVTAMTQMFENCQSLTSLNLSSFNTSNVTTMRSMFNGCSSLTSLDLSNFDTSKTIDVGNMFNNCLSLHTLRLDNCEKATIEKIIGLTTSFPTGDIGMTRKIFCNRFEAYDLTPPDGWVFALVD